VVDFGCQNDLVTFPILGERLADSDFASVDIGSVEQIDAGVQRPVDHPHCLVLRGGITIVVRS
jgi:hypothetical protein